MAVGLRPGLSAGVFFLHPLHHHFVTQLPDYADVLGGVMLTFGLGTTHRLPEVRLRLTPV
jgi:hypothetical protein